MSEIDDIPWYYINSKAFLAENIWYELDEIISDIKTMSVLDFIHRYDSLGL